MYQAPYISASCLLLKMINQRYQPWIGMKPEWFYTTYFKLFFKTILLCSICLAILASSLFIYIKMCGTAGYNVIPEIRSRTYVKRIFMTDRFWQFVGDIVSHADWQEIPWAKSNEPFKATWDFNNQVML